MISLMQALVVTGVVAGMAALVTLAAGIVVGTWWGGRNTREIVESQRDLIAEQEQSIAWWKSEAERATACLRDDHGRRTL